MTHYEERLAKDLEQIHGDLVQVGRLVESALETSLEALLTLDKPLAYRTILGDNRINRDIRAIDARCHAFVARHLPSAGHLRFVSSILRMTIEVERVGDYASTICRAAVQLQQPLGGRIVDEFKSVGMNAIQMYREALDAFEESDHNKALAVKSQADMVERSFITAFDEIIDDSKDGKRDLRESFDLFIALNRYERVAGQAKNLCEETVFWLTGGTKPPKRYRILFLDDAHDGRLNLALALAHKTFPESGAYSATVSELEDPALAQFFESRGLDVDSGSKVDWHPGIADPPHVIVALSGSTQKLMDSIPFHSVAFDWDLPAVDKDAAPGDKQDQYSAQLNAIAFNLRSLIEALRGEEHAV